MDADPGRLSLGTQLLILLVLTLVNAFFAMSEMALVSSSKPKLKAIAEDTSDGDARAEKVLLLLEEPTAFLSAIQVAITLAGFLSSALASFNLSGRVTDFLSSRGAVISPQLAVVIITVLLSYFTLVLGELVPKRIALVNPEKIAMSSIGIIRGAKFVFTPFVWLLSASVNGIMKLFKLEDKGEDSEYMEEEIINLLETGQEQGEIDESGKEMISSIFDLDDASAVEIMTPRTDVYMIQIDKPASEFVDEMLMSRHARVPVYDKDQDDIKGVLFLKDFILEARNKGFDNVDIKPLLKEPFFVPEGKKINDLLDEMQKKRQQIALLIDEYGGFSGVVTIEDILEEIVGSIEEEYDEEAPKLEKTGENTYTADGLYNLEDLSDELGLELESDTCDTVGGFVTELIGQVPDESFIGRTAEAPGCVFKILEVSEKRIEKLAITITSQQTGGEE